MTTHDPVETAEPPYKHDLRAEIASLVGRGDAEISRTRLEKRTLGRVLVALNGGDQTDADAVDRVLSEHDSEWDEADRAAIHCLQAAVAGQAPTAFDPDREKFTKRQLSDIRDALRDALEVDNGD